MNETIPPENPGPNGSSGRGTPGQYMAMCLIVKNQHDDILEWVHHYLKLGVSRIYVYDHDSSHLMFPTLAHLVRDGVVQYQWITDTMLNDMVTPAQRGALSIGNWKGGVNAQLFVYRDCLERYGQFHQWMAFFDVDEFLLLKDRQTKDLPSFMQQYEPYGGLAVDWMMFGTSGHRVRPNGTTLSSYTKCFPTGELKTIANTRFAISPSGNPHQFQYRDGAYAVDENFNRVDGYLMAAPTTTKVVLNHYVTKSFEEFLAKAKRGSADGQGKHIDFLDAVDRSALQNCTDADALMEGRVWKGPPHAWYEATQESVTKRRLKR